MIKKYNVVLVPLHQREALIARAQSWASLAHNYLLGEHSWPHLTLYAFECEEKAIEAIWLQLNQACEEKNLELCFERISFISFDQEIFWVSLLPDHQMVLQAMHQQVARILNQPVKKTYDPHLTLFNTRHSDYQTVIAEGLAAYLPLADTFVLALGVSDTAGQLISLPFLSRSS